MEVKWLVFLTFAGLGISFVAGNSCSTDTVFTCYNSLVHYEGLGFPLYGEDEQALEETCTTINDLFDCLDDYLKACYGKDDCDEKCNEIIKDIGLFKLNTGLRNLQSELCDPLSPMRMTYLDNYVCLEDNADHYAKCQNDSQLAQEYMTTIVEHDEAIYARCCFFSWYEACFTNITRDTCNANATFYVSMSLKYLMGHIVEHLCKDSDVVCSKPVLSSNDLPILTNTEFEICAGEGCDSNSTEPPHDELDDTTIPDVDNCVEENCLSSSRGLVLCVSNLFISMCCVAFFKYLILIK